MVFNSFFADSLCVSGRVGLDAWALKRFYREYITRHLLEYELNSGAFSINEEEFEQKFNNKLNSYSETDKYIDKHYHNITNENEFHHYVRHTLRDSTLKDTYKDVFGVDELYPFLFEKYKDRIVIGEMFEPFVNWNE